jgi:MFS family permease
MFELVGPTRAGVIMGVSFVVHQVAAAVGPYASGLLFDATGTYRLAFVVLGIVMFLALFPAAFTHPEGAPLQPTRARPGAHVARDGLS